MPDILLNDGTPVSSDLEGHYGTVAGGNSYFKLNREVWDDTSDTDKHYALIEATRLIDRLNFKGTKNSTLEFPRDSDTVVPDAITYAAYELAIKLLDDVDVDLEHEALRVTEDRYVSVNTKRNTDFTPEHIQAGIVSIKAWHYLKPYLKDSQYLRVKRDS
jgi:hypothetical protein